MIASETPDEEASSGSGRRDLVGVWSLESGVSSLESGVWSVDLVYVVYTVRSVNVNVNVNLNLNLFPDFFRDYIYENFGNCLR